MPFALTQLRSPSLSEISSRVSTAPQSTFSPFYRTPKLQLRQARRQHLPWKIVIAYSIAWLPTTRAGRTLWPPFSTASARRTAARRGRDGGRCRANRRSSALTSLSRGSEDGKKDFRTVFNNSNPQRRRTSRKQVFLVRPPFVHAPIAKVFHEEESVISPSSPSFALPSSRELLKRSN